MSELVDFMLEREKRLLHGMGELLRLEERDVVACNCGSTRFWLAHDASVECAKCQQKKNDIRWILNNG